MRDFEVIPCLLNIAIVNNFYNDLNTMDLDDKRFKSVKDLRKILGEDVGVVFTFFKFVYFVIKISLYIFSDPQNIPNKFRNLNFTTDEKLYMLLERLEIS